MREVDGSRNLNTETLSSSCSIFDEAGKIRMTDLKLKVVSLFSGCGGMDLGFKLEGFEMIWANDIDHYACETYKKNFGDVIVEGHIADIDFSTIPDSDVILGGFPCQDFSAISSIWNHPGILTERGNMYRHFVRAVVTKQPKAFVAENVKGLASANKGRAMQVIFSDFTRAGYQVYTKVYNFAEYGVPQFRERLLLVGIRNDLKRYYYPPDPTHGPGRTHQYVTAGEALKGVENVPYNNEKHRINKRTIEILKRIPEGGNFSSIPKNSKFYVKGLVSHVYRRLDRNKPAYTIIAAGGGGTWGYHFSEPRALTNRERARLQTFPDDFVFVGSVSEVRRQIGNAVPPEGVRPIARRIREILSGSQIPQVSLDKFTNSEHED